MRGLSVLIAPLLLGIAAGVARGGDQMVPLVSSGNWFAAAHQAGTFTKPDVCLVSTNHGREFGFRGEAGAVELRVRNPAWSLPSHVSGSVSVAVGDFTRTYEVASNGPALVSSVVPAEDIDVLFTAMSKAATMVVTVGKDAPFRVGLAGSARATNAFRTCAGIGGTVVLPGTNPFQ